MHKRTQTPCINLERIGRVIGLTAAAALVTGCGHTPIASTPRPPVAPVLESSPAHGPQVLAGEWEYEEGGMVVSLVLDERGNGDYDFKGGRFETRALSDHTWTGKWAQRENDREGGFEVTLSPDYSEGEGRWWYTRIERDMTPSKSGGRFKVIRVKNNEKEPGHAYQTWVH